MIYTSIRNTKELIFLSEKILNQRPPLTHLNLSKLVDSDEEAKQGEQLLHALASILEPTLISLNLSFNKNLWRDGARFNLLLEVLQHQSNLEDLNLEKSGFSAEQTQQLLGKVSECEILKSITTLNLYWSANFAYNESVNFLALILAKAHRI